MDFDSIITFFFLLAFFILPGILKQIKAAKAKTTTPKKAPKNPSLFDKIGEKIQQFVRELEQQAQQQRQAGNDQSLPSQNRPEQNEPWDAFKEDEASHFDFETLDQEDSSFADQEPGLFESKIPTPKSSVRKELIDSSREDRKIKTIKKPITRKAPTIQRPIQAKYIFKANPLQNAVIWSEILGKPVGLKN